MLEVAVAVARSGDAQRPPVPSPPALRRFLRFTKLPSSALGAARRSLDDDEFRQRVLDAVQRVVDDPGGDAATGQDVVGEVGWLLLDRPEGWAARVDALLADHRDRAAAADEERDDRRAARRLARTEAELARARAERDDADAARDAARADAEALRSRLGLLEARTAAVRDELASVEQARAEAVRQLKVAEQRAADRARELHEAQDGAAELRRALSDRTAELQAVAAEVDPAATPDPDPPDAGHETEQGDLPAADLAAVSQAVREAAAAAEALGAALGRAGSLLGPDEAGSPAAPEPPPAAGPGRGHDEGGTRPSGREAVPLPRGVFDDSVEAALFLLRVPATVLVVDGYNVSMAGWPDEALAVQRRRLIDELRNVQARTGVEPIVVFDGADVHGGPTGSLPRSVQVRFSPPGVTADDVIVRLVGQLPEDRPVVVVSSDREVRSRSSSLGASIVGSAQLLEVLRPR